MVSGSYLDGLSFNFDSSLIAYGHEGKSINIYSLESKSVISSIILFNEVTITAFSYNYNHLTVATQDNTIRVFNLDSKSEIFKFSAPSKIHSLKLFYNDNILASWSYDRILRIWYLDDGKLIQKVSLKDVEVNALAFSNSDNTFAYVFELM